MDTSPLRQLAEHLIGDLDEFVMSRRNAGMSWRRISLELRDATDRRIDVAHQTLRNWYPEENGAAA